MCVAAIAVSFKFTAKVIKKTAQFLFCFVFMGSILFLFYFFAGGFVFVLSPGWPEGSLFNSYHTEV